MKAVVSCKDFKSAVDRALAVVPKKSGYEPLTYIKVEANSDGVYVSGTDTDSYIKVKAGNFNFVDEAGECWLSPADIKKVYTLTGDMTISNNGNVFTVKNGKKKSVIPSKDYSNSYPAFPAIGENAFMNINEDCLLETITLLYNFTGKEYRFDYYYFDGSKERIFALDAYHAGVRDFSNKEVFCGDSYAIVPNFVYGQMKKILSSKSSRNIEVKLEDKSKKAEAATAYNYITFCGDDFTYWVRLCDGNLFKLDGCIGEVERNRNAFTLDSAEILSLAKEYDKFNSKDFVHPYPMMIGYDKDRDRMSSGIVVPNFETYDRIESFKHNKCNAPISKFVCGLNCQYLADVMQCFPYDHSVNCLVQDFINSDQFFMLVKPIVFYSDDSDFSAVVFPVNIRETVGVSKFRNYMLED